MKTSATYPRIALGVIILCSVAVTLIQTTRATPLIDYSYQLENAYRIVRGQMPYRDFILVLPPGLYILIAGVFLISSGYIHIAQLIFVSIVQAGTVFLTYVIASLIADPLIALLVTIPLVFAGQSLYSYSSYDITAVLFILISIYFILQLLRRPTHRIIWFIIVGAVSVIPAFFKQNIGLAYWVATGLTMFVAVVLSRSIRLFRFVLGYSIGGAAVISVFMAWLLVNHALGQFIYQVFIFPGAIRNPLDRLLFVWGQYKEESTSILVVLTFLIVWILIERMRNKIKLFQAPFHTIILLASFTWMFMKFFYSTSQTTTLERPVFVIGWGLLTVMAILVPLTQLFRGHTFFTRFRLMLPLSVIGSAQVMFFSHGIEGSSYGIWPLFFFVFAANIHTIQLVMPCIRWKPIVVFICVVLTFTLANQAFQLHQLQYFDKTGPMEHASIRSLYGMSSPGVYISQFEGLLTYVEHTIPAPDRIAVFPGEDPFFVVTGRGNPLSFSQLHPATLPLTSDQIIGEIYTRRVDWIIVKTHIQTDWSIWLYDLQPILNGIRNDFTLKDIIPGYEIYTRTSH